MKILVIGGAGLIGQAICKKHLYEGDDVFFYDTKVNPYNDYTVLLGTEVSDLGGFLLAERPEVVSHQAAFVGVGESQYSPLKYYGNNVGSVSNLLQLLTEYKSFYTPELLILAGSMGPYGEGRRFCASCNRFVEFLGMRQTLHLPCSICGLDTFPALNTEDTPLLPVSVYGLSKLVQEKQVELYANTFNTSVVSLRYFSVYGEGGSPNNPYTGVFSIIAKMLLCRQEVLLNEDGLQTRDLVHTEDVARAHFLASRSSVLKEGAFTALNVGTGRRTSMSECADLISGYLGGDVGNSYKGTGHVRLGDVRDSCADIQRIIEILGWHPQVSVFEGASRYCKWLVGVIGEGKDFSDFSSFEDAKKLLLNYSLFN